MWRLVILILIGILVIDVCWEMLGRHLRDEWARELRRRERMGRRYE